MTIRTLSRLSAALIATTSSMALAQDNEIEEETFDNESIIVTGTKQNKSLQETDASVAVVTSEQIDDQAVFDLSDALLRVPNVNLNPGSVFNFSIRGIANRGAGFAGTGQTANIYVDGMPVANEGLTGAFNLWDVSQIEVLRGPQATVQGRNALAGAIIMQTEDPQYDWGAAARVLVGTEETFQASAMITGPIIADQVAFRIAADYRERDFDGFNAIVQEPRGEGDATTLRAKLLVEPEAISGLRVEFNGQYEETFSSGSNTSVNGPAITDPAAEDYDPFSLISFDGRAGVVDFEAKRFITDLTYEFSENWYFAAVLGYEDIDRRITNALDSGDQRLDETYQIDARLHFDYDRLSGWVGGYYFDQSQSFDSVLNIQPSTFGLIADPPSSLIAISSAFDRQTENIAIYGELTYEITDRLSINIGARYDTEEVDDTGIQGSVAVTPETCTVELAPGFAVPCIVAAAGLAGGDEGEFSGDFDAFLPKVAVRYQFTDDQSIAFTFQQGYRAGGADTVTAAPGAGQLPVTNIESFEPEFLDNYELSYRSLWLDGDLVINANAFYSEYQDQQVRIPVPPFDFRTLNAGESEIYGFELSADYEMSSVLDIYAGLGYAKTEFIDFPFAVRSDAAGNIEPLPNIPELANLAGNEFQGAPNWNANFGASYRDEDGLFGSINANFTDSQFSDVENFAEDAVGSFWLVNARIGYDFDGLRISAFANNLLDERAFTSLNNSTTNLDGDGSITNGVIRGFSFTAPRFYGVEFEYRF
ncbi:MAG: TonB-dependent receptor [Pseudomonadota bacterium]